MDPLLPTESELSLDPADWTAHQALAHRVIDDAIRHLQTLRDRPVWSEMPDAVRARLQTPAPTGPTPVDQIYAELKDTALAYPMGNVHPRFWGWYMGSSNFTGALADFIAAIDGSNLGGGNTGAAQVERQVIGWFREMMDFPESASGTLTSGGSMANLIGLTVARNTMAGVDVRRDGVTDLPQPLRFYASAEAHSCHQKALESLGLGSRSLHLIPTNDALQMDLAALEQAIAADRAAGLRPVCVIGTAGTTNSGSIDDLTGVAALCRAQGLWFHVDGCIGALMRIAPRAQALVRGIEAADSIALDPHKWMHVPFESGVVLVRDGAAHLATFALHPDYLKVSDRGVVSGPFLADYGLELSRGFKALKIWMSIREHGIAAFGSLIDQNIEQAAYLADRIRAHPRLELLAPVPINIVCFRYCGPLSGEQDLAALNLEIMLRLQESGVAVLSDTLINGTQSLRVAINNHRTQRSDLDSLLTEVLRHGDDIAGRNDRA